MKSRFHEAADVELTEAVFYYDGKASGLGDRLLAEVMAATRRIEQYPEIAPVIDYGVRAKALVRLREWSSSWTGKASAQNCSPTNEGEASGSILMPRFLSSAVLVVCMTVIAVRSGAEPLPPLPAQTLSGKKIVVPRDLQGTSIVVVGFTKRSRKETEGWSSRLRNDRQIMTTVSVYDVVALDGVPGFIRSAILRQLLSGVPKERHDRFLIVSDAVDKWKRFLGATEEDNAYVAVIGLNGEVIWTARGAVTEAAWDQLKRSAAAKPFGE